MKYADKIHGFGDKAKEQFLGKEELEIIHKLIDEVNTKTHMIDFLSAYEQAHIKTDGFDKATELSRKVNKTLETIRTEAAGDEAKIYDVHVIGRILRPLELAFRLAANDIEKFEGEMIPPGVKARALEFYAQLDKAIKDFIQISGPDVNFNPE